MYSFRLLFFHYAKLVTFSLNLFFVMSSHSKRIQGRRRSNDSLPIVCDRQRAGGRQVFLDQVRYRIQRTRLDGRKWRAAGRIRGSNAWNAPKRIAAHRPPLHAGICGAKRQPAPAAHDKGRKARLRSALQNRCDPPV